MNQDETLYCTFHSAGRWFGVPVLDVKEVAQQTRWTRIPHAPPEVLGFVNLRGHIFLALHLARLLTVQDHSLPENVQMVILKPTIGQAFGIIVDHVGEIVAVTQQQKEAFSGEERQRIFAEDRASLVSEICKLEDRLLIVLDPRRFLPRVEQSIQTISSS